MRYVGILISVLIVMLLVARGARDEHERATLVYVNSSGINTLDPAAMTWNQDLRVARNIWEGLTRHDPATLEVVAGAADWPVVSADGLTYTFRIRAGSRWSNGDKVTAHDFVRGWRRAIEPGTAADYAQLLTDRVAGAKDYYAWRNDAVGVLSGLAVGGASWRAAFEEHVAERETRFASVGFRAVDEETFEVRLIRPCSYFLELCAFPTLGPVHERIEDLRIEMDGTGLTAEGLVAFDPQWTKPDYRANGYAGLVTNGAYRITDWQFRRRLRMERNPHYRAVDSVVCRSIEMAVYRDLNAAIMAYEAGDVEFLPEMAVPYDHELARLSATGARPDIHCPPVFGTYYYLFNSHDAEVGGRANPFVDARVRRAFVMAIDRTLLVRKVVDRGEKPIGQLIPPGVIEGYVSPGGLPFDPDKARQLLGEAGYPNGAGMEPIDLLYNTGFDHGKVSQALAEMWRRELGVTVVPRGKEVKTFVDDRQTRRFMIARAGWYGDYADPTTYLDVFATGNGNNDAGFSNVTFDGLLKRSDGITDAGARLALLSEAERLLVEDEAGVLPLYQYTQLLAIKPGLQGLHPNPRLLFLFDQVTVP